jgi:hypothetical protein
LCDNKGVIAAVARAAFADKSLVSKLKSMTVDSEEGLRQMMLAKSGKSTRFRAHLVTTVKRPAQLAA